MTLYQIKPLFQSLLRPTMFWLYKHHVTANHITLTALALSLFTGLLLVLVAQPILFLLLPIVLFIRMALNALDDVDVFCADKFSGIERILYAYIHTFSAVVILGYSS